MPFIIGLLVAAVVQTGLSAFSIGLVARWTKAERASAASAFLSAAVLVALTLIFGLLVLPLQPIVGGLGPALLAWCASLPIQVLLQWFVLTRVHRVSAGPAGLMWLVHLGLGAAFWLTAGGMVLPFVVQAFVSPTNSMAPTLRGYHQIVTCSACGGRALVSAPAPAVPGDMSEYEWGIYRESSICEQCFTVARPVEIKNGFGGPDRFLLNKVRSVRRWDVAAFRYPDDPSVLYIMRVVGLPGETVEIQEGSVWINGQVAELPDELKGLQYLVPEDDHGNLRYATEGDPIQLSDEYFVLGDFSVRSYDSRYWGPVPKEHMIGVLTARYWPPSRWKFWP